MSKTKMLLIGLLVISGVMCAVVLFEGYKQFENKNTTVALAKVKSELNKGDYAEAKKLLASIDSNNLFTKSLYSQEATALSTYKSNSDIYNSAIANMNNSNFSQALQLLKGINTTNPYLKGKIKTAVDYCNINYTKQLYNKGLQALKNKDVKGVQAIYTEMDKLYPDSAFTKQLDAYMTGKAKATISSYNIEISNPNSSGFTPISLDGETTTAVGGTGSSNLVVQQPTQTNNSQVTTTTTTTTTHQPASTVTSNTTNNSSNNGITSYVNKAKNAINNSISTTYSSSQQQQQDEQRSKQSQQDSTSYQKSCDGVDNPGNVSGGLTSTSYSNN